MYHELQAMAFLQFSSPAWLRIVPLIYQRNEAGFVATIDLRNDQRTNFLGVRHLLMEQVNLISRSENPNGSL